MTLENNQDSSRKLQEYYDKLIKATDNTDVVDFIFNDDVAHNAIVVAAMMNKSSSIKMFCGKMFLFRKEFKEALKSKKGEGATSYVEKVFRSNFDAFIQKNGKMEIIMKDEPEADFMNHIREEFYEHIKSGAVKICTLLQDATPSIIRTWNHFTVAGKQMFRHEIDEDDHTAMVSMRDPAGAEIYLRSFELLEKISKPISF